MSAFSLPDTSNLQKTSDIFRGKEFYVITNDPKFGTKNDLEAKIFQHGGKIVGAYRFEHTDFVISYSSENPKTKNLMEFNSCVDI